MYKCTCTQKEGIKCPHQYLCCFQNKTVFDRLDRKTGKVIDQFFRVYLKRENSEISTSVKRRVRSPYIILLPRCQFLLFFIFSFLLDISLFAPFKCEGKMHQFKSDIVRKVERMNQASCKERGTKDSER